MMSDTPIENKENKAIARVVMDDNAVARVALLLNLSVISTDNVGVFEQSDLPPEEEGKDLMFHVADDETVLYLSVSSDALKELREAGYNV